MKEEGFPSIHKRTAKDDTITLLTKKGIDPERPPSRNHMGTSSKTPAVAPTGNRKMVKTISTVSQAGHPRFKINSASMDRRAFIEFYK